MKKIKNLITILHNIGIDDKLSNTKKKTVRLLNGVSLIFISGVLLILLLSFFMKLVMPELDNMLLVIITDVSAILLISLSFIFNYKRKYFLSKLNFLIVFSSIVVIYSIIFGKDYLMEYYLLVLMLLPLLLFEHKKTIFFISSLIFALFIAIQLSYSHFTPILKVPDIAVSPNIVLTFVFVFVIVNYFNNENTRNEEIIANEKEQVEQKNSKITDSINYAKRIQQAVFPSVDFLNKNFTDSFIFFRPRGIVSGDFYWTTKRGNKIIIAVADCTGHGVPGAFMSLLGISFLNEVVLRAENNTAGEILNFMRQKIKTTLKQTGKNNEQKDGMDMALCIVDTENQKLEYAGAYNPLYITRKQDKLTSCKNLANYKLFKQNNTALIEIKADKQPLAIHVKEKPFTTHQIDIQKNDKLYLFSDGYADQFNGKNGKKFMARNFKKTLIAIYDNPMNEQLDILNKTLDNWQNGSEQIDDILIVGIQI